MRRQTSSGQSCWRVLMHVDHKAALSRNRSVWFRVGKTLVSALSPRRGRNEHLKNQDPISPNSADQPLAPAFPVVKHVKDGLSPWCGEMVQSWRDRVR